MFNGDGELLRRHFKAATITCCRTGCLRRRGRRLVSGFPNTAGISIGGTSTFTSPTLGAESFSETVLASGTVRGRIGYAPGNWLFYATGGFAWTYDQITLTQVWPPARPKRRFCGARLGGRRRRRGAGRAALDRAARISVHRLRQRQRDFLRRTRSGSIPTSSLQECAPA